MSGRAMAQLTVDVSMADALVQSGREQGSPSPRSRVAQAEVGCGRRLIGMQQMRPVRARQVSQRARRRWWRCLRRWQYCRVRGRMRRRRTGS